MDAALRSYQPTWRDQLAQWMLGPNAPTPERKNFVSGLLGSAGLGSTGASVSDFTPVGGLLGAQEAAQRGDMKGMALAALPMPARAASGVLNAVEREAPHIIAYHGSPHSFDRFDLSKIGTGEGAQAYGHGLYFAQSEDVAKNYRDNLSRRNIDATFDGKPVEKWPAVIDEVNKENWRLGKLLDEYGRVGGDYGDFVRRQRDWYRGQPEMEAALGEFEKRVSATHTPGSMYQVRINADPAHFLDWDKPLSEQSPVVREVVKSVIPNVTKQGGPALSSEEFAAKYGSILRGTPYEALPERALTSVLSAGPEASKDFVELVRASNPEAAAQLSRAIVNFGSPTGEQIYHEIGSSSATTANLLRAPDRGVEASAMFREAGIPGIKYLDAGSRGAGEGSRNYVVFDDKLIDILKKYGLGGILGGGAAMGSGSQSSNAPVGSPLL